MDSKGILNLVLSALMIGLATAGTAYQTNPQMDLTAIAITGAVAALGALMQQLRQSPFGGTMPSNGPATIIPFPTPVPPPPPTNLNGKGDH